MIRYFLVFALLLALPAAAQEQVSWDKCGDLALGIDLARLACAKGREEGKGYSKACFDGDKAGDFFISKCISYYGCPAATAEWNKLNDEAAKRTDVNFIQYVYIIEKRCGKPK